MRSRGPVGKWLYWANAISRLFVALVFIGIGVAMIFSLVEVDPVKYGTDGPVFMGAVAVVIGARFLSKRKGRK